MGRALWLPDALRSYGVTVIETAGWSSRGSATFNPQVIIAHHTANPNQADMPSLNLLINGRSGLPGPLCQVGLSRSGKAYIVASGRANHAGSGSWRGISGNTNALGIEAENNGVGEPWPAAQLEAYFRIAAAMCDHTSPPRGAEWVCGHKEWAPSRKVDPRGIDMNWFRGEVAARRAAKANGTLPGMTPGPAPAPGPTPGPPSPPGHPHDTPLVKFATGGPDSARVHGAVRRPNGTWVWQTNYSQVFWEVVDIQAHLKEQGHNIVVDGIGGPSTRDQLIAYQRARGLTADAVAGPATWAKLHGQVAPAPPPPPPPPPPHSHPTPLVKNAPVNGVWRGQVYHPEAGKWFIQSKDAWWEIRDVQQHLKNQGHDIVVDGFGGPTTNHHIVVYQRHRGLTADGVVGPATWAKLHG